MQKRRSFQADVDERRLHARHDSLHLALVDIADHAAAPAAFDVQLLQHAVFDHRDSGFAWGDVDQDLFAHGARNSRNSRAVSNSGNPITPEKLPDKRAMSACARPWIA